MVHPLRKTVRRFVRARAGSALIVTAIALPVLVGFAGLSIDIGSWYAHKRVIQSAADAAAVSGALEIMRTGSEAQILAAAEADAARNGYDPAKGDQRTIRHPPQSGPWTGSMDAVEVVLERPAPSFLSGILFADASLIAARAVAVADINDTCVWALNPFANGAVSVSGGGEVELGCGIISNSNASDSLSQVGSGCLTATRIKAVGGASGSCINPPPISNVKTIADPLAGLEAPTFAGCDVNGKTKVNAGQSVTLMPGVYCGAIEVQSSGSVTFEPGLYVLDGAGMTISSNASVTGTGVSFYLTGSGTPDSISLSAGASVSLSAPFDGPLPGILFYHDRNACGNITHSLTGGATMDLEGIVYFPCQDVKFAGGTSVNNNATMIIADTVQFTGATNLGDFDGTSVEANKILISATLVE